MNRSHSPSGPIAPAALAGAVIAFHVVDHQLVPPRLHLFSHVAAGMSATIAAATRGASGEDLGLDPARFRSGLRAGLIAGATAVGAIGVASTMPVFEAVLADPRAADTTTGSLAYRVAIDIPLGTALYEELVFRGALLALMRQHLPDRAAVGVTSALFGLWHVLPALEDRHHNPVAQRYHLLATVTPTVAVTAVAGLGFCRLRLRSGHIIAPIVAHALANAAALIAATAINRRRARRTTTAATEATAESSAPPASAAPQAGGHR